jgi:thymidylate synthase
MSEYKKLLSLILEKGTAKEPSRDNIPGSISYFGSQLRYDLRNGFPLNTLKPVSWKGLVYELLWFLKGDTNIKYLDKNGVDFMWHQDAYNYFKKVFPTSEESFSEYILMLKSVDSYYTTQIDRHDRLQTFLIGDCGYQYGSLWREFNGVDQIVELIEGIRKNPESRRHIVTALKPDSYDDMALFTCHNFFQFNCRKMDRFQKLFYSKDVEYYLDCQFYQRSADMILGVPYNTASYALLTHIIARMCNMIPGDLIHTFGDAHIYENHIDAAKEIISRDELEFPELLLSENVDWRNSNISEIIYNLDFSDFSLLNYKHHPKTKAEAKLNTGLL